MKKSIVYWAPFYDPTSESHYEFLIEEPKSVFKELHEKDLSNKIKIQSCPAIRNHEENVFYISNPTYASIKDGLDGSNESRAKSLKFIGTAPAIASRSRIIYDLSYIFFSESEEPLIMKLTPPYLHRTESSKYGHIASGEYDISSWFRPISADFQLWEGVRDIVIPKQEAVMYLHFDKKVELRKFRLNSELYNLAKASVAYKDFNPNQSLTNLYKKFKLSKYKKFVINQIKLNLMEQ